MSEKGDKLAGFTVKQGSLYICSKYSASVPMSTIVEITYLDYINDFVAYRSTCGFYVGNNAVETFICNFEPYVPATIDEGLAYSGPKCECGVNKTYPKEDTTYMHSDWCPLYKKEQF